VDKINKEEVNKEEEFTLEDYTNLFKAVGLVQVGVNSKENQILTALLGKIDKFATNLKNK